MIANLKKVLFVGPYPPPYSGPELSMQLFLRSDILKRSFNILFLQTNFRRDNVKKGKFGISMMYNFFKFFFKYLWLLLTSGAQIIYYPITTTEIGWLGRDALTILLAKLFKKKIIIHLRGSHFKLNYQSFSQFGQGIVRYSLQKVDCAIVQSKYLRDQFQPFIPESKTYVLSQAIDTDEFHNNNISGYSTGMVLIVGHLTKAKGYNDIVEIIPEVVENFPEAQFYFAGNIRKGERNVFFNQWTGDKLNYEDPFQVEKIILESSYGGHYHNLGIITGKEKVELFKRCQVFVSASYSEGFSRSLLEAMLMGKPIVYTPVGAHREVLKDGINGLCVEPGNKKQLSDINNCMIKRYL